MYIEQGMSNDERLFSKGVKGDRLLAFAKRMRYLFVKLSTGHDS